jgi:hypothetical protein
MSVEKVGNKEIPTEVLHKEIDLIQGCIARMANNNFLLKGWCLSVAGLLIGFGGTNQSARVGGVTALLLILAFWALSAHFLLLERRYREFYNTVILKRLKGDASELYFLDAKAMTKHTPGFIKTCFSGTLIGFYGVIALVTVGVTVFWLRGD